MSNTGIRNYFISAFDGVWTALKGMQITAKYFNIFREKPITLCYPDENPDVQPGFRGKHVYVVEKCIACRLCERACPIDCITMDIEGKGKTAIVHGYKIDFGKCLLCNLCSEACPVNCLWLGEEYGLTQYSRAACEMELLDASNADLKMPAKAKVAKAPKKPKPAPKPKVEKTEEKPAAEPEAAGDES